MNDKKENETTTITKVGIYVRVSTQEQAKEGYSIGEQTERLHSYCKARGWTVVQVYTDPGFSGAKTDRPALQSMIADIKAGVLDVVLVYKLDRLSRSQKDTLYLIEDVFLKNNVAFVSLNENFDTSTAFGRAMIGILSVFAQLEREQIKERTMMGKYARAKDGYFHGGGYYPIGYDYIDGNLVINEYEAMQVRLIVKMFLEEHKHISAIKTYMNKNYTNKNGSWNSNSSIYSVLTTKIYCGYVKYNDEYFQGNHEPIYSLETFEAIQERLNDPRRFNDLQERLRNDPFKSTRLLSNGMLHCAQCGSTFYARGVFGGHAPKKNYRPYYICYSVGKPSARKIKDRNCKNKMYAVADLDYLIVTEIRKLSFDESYLDKLISIGNDGIAEKEQLDVMENRVKEIDIQCKRVMDLYQLGTIPIENISERINNLSTEKINLRRTISEIKSKKGILPKENVIDILESADDVFKYGTMEEKQELIKSLIKHIDIDGEHITIHWAFTP